MNRQTANSHSYCGQRVFAGTRLRPGITRKQLLFVMICAGAIGVMTMILASFFGPDSGVPKTSGWQCLDCGYEFDQKTTQPSPIECPKCGGEAVRLYYYRCPNCGKDVLVSRMRVIESARAQYRQQGGDGGQGSPRLGAPPPLEAQYRLKQPDGSFAWSPWTRVKSPESRRIQGKLRCPYCGSRLMGGQSH